MSAIERAILSRAGKVLEKPPESVPFFKRFHVPMMFVEARVIRRKAPVTLEPKVVREKEEMLAAECAECGSGRWRSSKRPAAATSVNTGWRIRFWEA